VWACPDQESSTAHIHAVTQSVPLSLHRAMPAAGKFALITGGAGGLGKAFAVALLESKAAGVRHNPSSKVWFFIN